MKYDVHIYAVVRLKVWNIEAGSQHEAIQKADATADLYRLLPDHTSNDRPDQEQTVELGGWAEDVEGYLVDEVGDEEHANTRYYKAGELSEPADRQAPQPADRLAPLRAALEGLRDNVREALGSDADLHS